MTVGVYDNCYTSWNGYPTDAGDKGLKMLCVVADADGVGLGGGTCGGDIDIVTACGESITGISAQRDVVAAATVLNERVPADGCIKIAVIVIEERLITGGRVPKTSGIARQRLMPIGRVFVPSGV